jgi:precorrin-6B methylase 1
MSKPREWYLWPDVANRVLAAYSEPARGNRHIHVIEFSAYQAVVERLKEALSEIHCYYLNGGYPNDIDNYITNREEYIKAELAKLGIEE